MFGLSALALEYILVSVIGCTCCPRNRTGADPGSSSSKTHVSLICIPPAHPTQGCWPREQAEGEEALTVVAWPLCLERPKFFGIWGEGWLRTKIIQGTEKKPEKQVLREHYKSPGLFLSSVPERLHGGDPSNGELLYLIPLLLCLQSITGSPFRFNNSHLPYEG